MARSLRPLDVYPITTRTLEVLRVTDVTPGMRRVTLGGPELAAHVAANGYPVAAFRSDGFDDEGKLILRHPDVEIAVGPEQADGVLNWPRADPHLLYRTYTVRRWDAVRGEVDLDFVTHGVGPATTWASCVQPGERVQWAGPKSSAPHPQGADWTLVAGDETALPAIGRWLEEWPAGARGQVFIEIAEPSHRQDLPLPDGVELTWLSRDGAEAGTTTLLFDALRGTDWWEGTVFAWVAGETLTLAPIRRWLRNEKGLPKEQVEVTGYWRRQRVVVDDDGVQDLDATEDEEERFHELSELAPAFALRVAATIGLAAALGGHAKPVAELAGELEVDSVGLGKLLRHLASIGVAERTGDGAYRLTSLGRELEDDDVAEALDLRGLPARRELGGLLSLLAAVRTGRGDHARWYGAEWTERMASDAALRAARVEEEAEEAGYTAGALAAAPVFAGLETVAVVGRAAGSFAAALVDVHPGLRATAIAAPSELETLRALHGGHERVAYVPGGLLGRAVASVDALLLAGALNTLPDADAAHALREAAASVRPGGRVLVFGEVLDLELAHEHDYEDDLLDFALTGGGARTHDEHVALFAAAGLGGPVRTTVGWGYTLYALTVAS